MNREIDLIAIQQEESQQFFKHFKDRIKKNGQIKSRRVEEGWRKTGLAKIINSSKPSILSNKGSLFDKILASKAKDSRSRTQRDGIMAKANSQLPIEESGTSPLNIIENLSGHKIRHKTPVQKIREDQSESFNSSMIS